MGLRGILFWIVLVIVLIAAGLFIWRSLDYRNDARVMGRLQAPTQEQPLVYSPDLVANQSEPVRRFFNHAIASGTPLRTAVELRLEGQFNMGTKAEPHEYALFAKQVLNYPTGFIWQVVLRTDEMWISGSDGSYDGNSWSNFWLLGVLPVARAGGTDDLSLSAFGRYAAEAVFWSPASVLPGPDAQWSAQGHDTARVELRRDGQSITVDVTLDQVGAPVKVVFDRWTDANSDKVFRMQRFGGYLSEPESFDGFTLPTRVVAGNHFETDAYFPFYEVKVVSARFGPN